MKQRHKRRIHFCSVKADDDSDSEEEGDDYVKRSGVCVYFYAEVTKKTILKMIDELWSAKKCAVENNVESIKLYINSNGGSVHDGLAGMDHIANMNFPVTTIADGMVASAATFLLIAGRNRVCMPHATILVHQVTAFVCGKFSELLDEIQNTQLIMDTLVRIYRSNTSLDDTTIKSLMSNELVMTASNALKNGFVDEIADGCQKKKGPSNTAERVDIDTKRPCKKKRSTK